MIFRNATFVLAGMLFATNFIYANQILEKKESLEGQALEVKPSKGKIERSQPVTATSELDPSFESGLANRVKPIDNIGKEKNHEDGIIQPDQWIAEKIRSTFMSDSEHLDLSDIEISVNGPVVTLVGTVSVESAKAKASELAFGVVGVETVSNYLVVKDPQIAAEQAKIEAALRERTFAQRLRDASITAKIKLNLITNDKIEGLKINVDTVEGNVLLEGKVRSQSERQQAHLIASDTDGVIGVNNRINVIRLN